MFKHIFNSSFSVIITILVPLLTIPYIIASIGINNFGQYVKLSSFVIFFNIVTDFGFNMFIPKALSKKKRIGELFKAYIFIKFFVFIIFASISYNLYEINTLELFSLFLLGFFSFYNIDCFLNSFNLYKEQVVATVISKIVYLFLIFTVDFSEESVCKLLLITAISVLLYFFVEFIFIYKKIKWSNNNLILKDALWLINNAKGFYFSKLVVNIYQQGSVFIVSQFLGASDTAIYSIVTQLYKIGLSLLGSISRVLYTINLKKYNPRMIEKYIIISIIIYIFLVPLIYFSGESILKLLFDENVSLIFKLSFILFLSLIFSLVSSFCGYPLLTPIGREKDAHIGIAISSFFYFFVIIILSILEEHDIYLFVYLIGSSEFICMIYRLYSWYRNRDEIYSHSTKRISSVV